MVDLTKEKSDQLRQAICPECGCDYLRKGPRGGLCINVQCAGCKREYNITAFGPCELLREPIVAVCETETRNTTLNPSPGK